MAEWSQLPKDILDLVAKHLNTSFDLLRFRSVCSTWRSSVALNPHPSPSHFPVPVDDGLFETFWNFKLFKRTIIRLGFAPPNIQTPPHSSSSSSDDDGWLIKVEQGQVTHLLNPLARQSIKNLPKSFPRRLDLLKYRVSELGHEYILQYAGCRSNLISDAGGSYLEKVALCSRPCLGSGIDSYVFLTIHVSGKLASFKFGEKKWTIVDDFPSPYDDVILFEQQFYAVDNTGRIVLVNVDESSPVVNLIAPSVFGGDKKALVESGGELLLVDAYLSIGPGNDLSFDEGLEFYEDLDWYMIETMVRFKVFRLDRSEQKWVEVDSLGDKMLFLGDHCTFSAFASDFCGCKGNCIIFTDPLSCSIKDQGDGMKGHVRVFDLESGNIDYLGNYPDYWKMFWPPPPWVSSTMLEVGLDQLSI